ncbi:MAG: cytochrome c maturation protein CcmE [Coriobacteriia bacterium]|nr:cytochrome c maturation protein CcmE [Coriobacteriia bacterium]
MNSKTKKRMIVVAGVILIVVIVLLAVVGGSSSATVTTVKDASAGAMADKKIQVSGAVVDNSYSVDSNGVLTFDIADMQDASATLHVSYDKGVSATFGNGIEAICTGRMDASGTLVATELVTKCPSKYENATDALGVSQLLGYGESMVGKTAKVAGTVKSGTLGDATQQVRFVLADADGAELPVNFGGALFSAVDEGARVVVTGALDASGLFLATDVALEG